MEGITLFKINIYPLPYLIVLPRKLIQRIEKVISRVKFQWRFSVYDDKGFVRGARVLTLKPLILKWLHNEDLNFS